MTAEELLEHAARSHHEAPPRVRRACQSVRMRGCALVSGARNEGNAGTGRSVPSRSEGRQVDPRSRGTSTASPTSRAMPAGCLAEVLSDA
jgi:hypothetical protein